MLYLISGNYRLFGKELQGDSVPDLSFTVSDIGGFLLLSCRAGGFLAM